MTALAWLVSAGVAALVALLYAGSCWWFPFAACWCCSGGGRHHRKDGRVFKDCWWCAGSGRRLRIGRKVWNHFSRLRKEAS